jgi:thiopurine S-methyltransferase
MAYLVQKGAAQVVGVDGIRRAFTEFVEEQPDLKISATMTTTANGFEIFRGPNVALLKGDYFELTEAAAGGKFGALFDRGSLVAIDPKVRQAYTEIVGKLMAPGGRILLVTVERRGSDVEAVKKGPPFSLSEVDIRQMYEGLDWVESVTLLDAKDEFEESLESREKFQGLDQLMQLAFLIQAK